MRLVVVAMSCAVLLVGQPASVHTVCQAIENRHSLKQGGPVRIAGIDGSDGVLRSDCGTTIVLRGRKWPAAIVLYGANDEGKKAVGKVGHPWLEFEEYIRRRLLEQRRTGRPGQSQLIEVVGILETTKEDEAVEAGELDQSTVYAGLGHLNAFVARLGVVYVRVLKSSEEVKATKKRQPKTT